MRHRWISPQFVSTNRVDAVQDYASLREMGQRVNEALGIGTSATHMEWFFGPKGLRFSEIGCRPPGVGAWDLYSAGNDLDLYRQWAHAVVHGSVEAGAVAPAGHRHRRAAAGPRRRGLLGRGRRRRAGAARRVRDRRPPAVARHADAAGRRPGYMANAWVRLKHPDYDVLRGMLDDVGRSVRVHAG